MGGVLAVQMARPSGSVAPGSRARGKGTRVPPSSGRWSSLAPIDDESCWIYCYGWNPVREIDAEERAKLRAGHGIMCEVDESYEPVRNPSNEFGIDPNAMALRFVTTRPWTTTAIFGASSDAQLDTAIASNAVAWTDELEAAVNNWGLVKAWNRIQHALRAFAKSLGGKCQFE